VLIASRISLVNEVLPLTNNYPTTQPLAWPFLIALAELEESATHGKFRAF
jgi:hypothetical protein